MNTNKENKFVGVQISPISFIDEGVDTGPLILQKSFLRKKEDSFELLKKINFPFKNQRSN